MLQLTSRRLGELLQVAKPRKVFKPSNQAVSFQQRLAKCGNTSPISMMMPGLACISLPMVSFYGYQILLGASRLLVRWSSMVQRRVFCLLRFLLEARKPDAFESLNK